MLKFKRIILLMTLFIIITMSAYSCWAYLSVDELFSKSDIILIGTVEGKSSNKIFSKYNKWNVEVHYYLKGKNQNKQLVVATPDDSTSLHYELNQWGKFVLLFLREEKNIKTNYIPLSPQGVVTVSRNIDILGKNITHGKELIKYLEIIDPKSEDEEKKEILHTIKGLDIRTISEVDNKSIYEDDDSIIINIKLYLFIGLLILLSFIFVYRFIRKQGK